MRTAQPNRALGLGEEAGERLVERIVEQPDALLGLGDRQLLPIDLGPVADHPGDRAEPA